MPKGVYKLSFGDKLYIGQAKDIDKRYKDHLYLLSKGSHSPKLQQAFEQFGKPTLNVLEYTDLVLEREAHYIALLKPELNTVGVKSFVVEEKFPETTYILVLEQLIEEESFEHLLMSEVTVENIYVGASHRHLESKLPILYNRMLLKIKERYKQKYIKDGVEYDRPEGVRLANILASQPYKGWTQKYADCLVSPTGVFLLACNQTCERFGLSISSISRVMTNKQIEHKGWKKCS